MAQTSPAAPAESEALTHRSVLAIAVPIVFSGLSTPLLGLVDTAIMGQLEDPQFIGAIAVGALIFTFIYWAFGFLRMGTTGLTAQAKGAGDGTEIRAALGRALAIAAGAGSLIILTQWLLAATAFWLIDGSADVERLARDYFTIRIWSAPFALANFALLGWFIGLGRAGTSLALQLILNVTNAALDILFVLEWNMGVSGVAYGTLIAEVTAALAGIVIAARLLRGMGGNWSWPAILAPEQIKRTIAVNRDIMIRTLLLMSAFAWFTAQGAKSGDVILAANAVLMQFVMFAAYFLDGFAFAAEALVGAAIGSARLTRFKEAVRLTTLWAAGTSLAVSLAYFTAGPFVIDGLTQSADVREAARTYLPWPVIFPVLSVWCFQLDGIFIGATATREMRNAAILSLAAFLIAWWLMIPLGNHGLWAALATFNIARALALGRYYPALLRRAFAANSLKAD